MPLIKSVSGIRGTIGGIPGENLTPPDIVSFVSAYASWVISQNPKPTVVIGRDGRISGAHVNHLVIETLRAMGVNVIDTGLSTTPSVEMYVTHRNADGGIIITASHNPREWNALKFLNARGEFISQKDGEYILALAASGSIHYPGLDALGTVENATDAIDYHIKSICTLALVDVEALRKKKFHVAVDCINSTGALAIPALLDALGCTYTLLNKEVNGEFAHNPEPLAEHLQDLCHTVISSKAVLGVAVDPDVDRLALVDETGEYFGEEYTLVAVADYVLQHTPGSVVSNLSSSMALRDVAQKHGQSYSASKVGEVHVVEEMKRTGSVIGGEGNGGIIYPELHYGRDALVGIALLLSYLARSNRTLSALKQSYPKYVMVKGKIALPKSIEMPQLLKKIEQAYAGSKMDLRDGIKIYQEEGWIHLRASNTEPIIRIYTESSSAEKAEALARSAQEKLKVLI